MKQFFINHIRFFVLLIVALFIGGGIWYIFSNTKPALGFYTVTRGNIISFLDIPGTVSSGNSVGSLPFSGIRQNSSGECKRRTNHH